jgi:hypothetical protein
MGNLALIEAASHAFYRGYSEEQEIAPKNKFNKGAKPHFK